MEYINISIASSFSKAPGPRFIRQGPHSGELFRVNVLEPKFKELVQQPGAKIVVDLDKTLGYGTSFLEEVFGGLARTYGAEAVASIIEIVSNEEPYLKDDIATYIQEANNKDDVE